MSSGMLSDQTGTAVCLHTERETVRAYATDLRKWRSVNESELTYCLLNYKLCLMSRG